MRRDSSKLRTLRKQGETEGALPKSSPAAGSPDEIPAQRAAKVLREQGAEMRCGMEGHAYYE